MAANGELRQALLELPFEVDLLSEDLSLDRIFCSLIDPLVGIEAKSPFLLIAPLLQIVQCNGSEPRYCQYALIRKICGGFDAIRLKRGFSRIPDTSDPGM